MFLKVIKIIDGVLKMKIKLKIEDKKPAVILKYENFEYQELKKVLEKVLGLEEYKTNMAFGISGYDGVFYRDSCNVLKNYVELKAQISYRNDVNSPVWDTSNQMLNLSIFRMVPDGNGVIKVPLNSFISIGDFSLMVKFVSTALQHLINVAVEEEVKINVKEVIVQ